MAILLTLGVVNLQDSLVNGRDDERKADIATLAQHLETFYTSGTDSSASDVECSGGNVTHVGKYTVHTFTSSETLVCTQSFSATVLVVAGGGGGGANAGGGGGGGGYLTGSQTISDSTTITVGSGGNGGTAGGAGGYGENSKFGTTMTAVGGGGGAAGGTNTGLTGGSGGGGGGSAIGTSYHGLGTSGQGYNGGDNAGYVSADRSGGGGGGAGGAGGDAVSATAAGNGGIGLTNDISGISVGYAGGGGGPNSTSNAGVGTQGGGNAVVGNNGQPGTPNTGGGGGGGSFAMSGGAGGSGVVIIRYQSPQNLGTYPSTTITETSAEITEALRDIDLNTVTAPNTNKNDPTETFKAAADAATLTSASTHPTVNEYVYQPLALNTDGSTWSLCTDSATQECRKFNLYYRLESDNTVYTVTSKNQ